MENHFIKNVEFENFKCFEKLKVKELKRVNLIGGKNNIGKTSFMEGLEMLVKPNSGLGLRMVLLDILSRRKQARKNINPFQPQVLQELKLDFFYSLEKIVNFKSNRLNVNFRYIPINGIIESMNIHAFNPQIMQNSNMSKIAPIPFIEFTVENDKMASPLQEVENNLLMMDKINTNSSVIFIPSSTTDEFLLASYLGSLMRLKKEKDLNNYLQNFDGNIISIKAIPIDNGTSVLELDLKDRQTTVSLSSLGEGTNRYIAIVCAIWASKDGYLFIDEIENGIHYTNYEKLWKIIFEASKQANCQVFATTHSKECIEAFNRVNESDEGIYHEFYRNQKNGLIVVKERDNEQLEYALTHNSEIRG